MPTNFPRPNPGRLYGVTHQRDGAPILREAKSLKVGIGQPSGRDIHVFVNDHGKWCLTIGFYEKGKRVPKTRELDTRVECEAKYKEMWHTVADRPYPLKLSYFTFLRINRDATFVHDFELIEKYGPMPTELPIVLMKEDAWGASFQWWATGELKCEGDGMVARRRLSLSKSNEEKALAEEAKAAGDKFFPIIEGCAEFGCPYVQGDKPNCKSHGRLQFQLADSPRIGSTVCFDTTGKKSISQIFTSLHAIRTMTGAGDPDAGRVAGIPLMMVLRPYKTSHNGQSSTQYGVSLEFRAEAAQNMAQKMIEYANDFREVVMRDPVPLQIAAHDEADLEEAADAMLNQEFYPDEDADEFQEGSSEAAQAVGAAKVEELKKRGAKVEPVPQEPTTPAVETDGFQADDTDLPPEMAAKPDAVPSEPEYRTDLR